MMNNDFVVGAVYETRVWMLKKICPVTWKLPNEDEVWHFITSKWATVSTEVAERILNKSLVDITT